MIMQSPDIIPLQIPLTITSTDTITITLTIIIIAAKAVVETLDTTTDIPTDPILPRMIVALAAVAVASVRTKKVLAVVIIVIIVIIQLRVVTIMATSTVTITADQNSKWMKATIAVVAPMTTILAQDIRMLIVAILLKPRT